LTIKGLGIKGLAIMGLGIMALGIQGLGIKSAQRLRLKHVCMCAECRAECVTGGVQVAVTLYLYHISYFIHLVAYMVSHASNFLHLISYIVDLISCILYRTS